MSNRLHLVQLPLVSRKECEKRFRTAGYQVEIDKTKICAGWLEGGKDACQVLFFTKEEEEKKRNVLWFQQTLWCEMCR